MDIFDDFYNWVFLVNILIVVEEKAQFIKSLKSCYVFNQSTSSSKEWLIVKNKIGIIGLDLHHRWLTIQMAFEIKLIFCT